MDLPLIGSYDLEAKPHSVQRTVNLIPVPQEPGNERTGWVLKDVKGLDAFVTSDTPIEILSSWDSLTLVGPASLSDTNQTATETAVEPNSMIFGTQAKSTGKRYFEGLIVARSITNTAYSTDMIPAFGYTAAATSISAASYGPTFAVGPNVFAMLGCGGTYWDNASHPASGVTLSANDVIGIAVDFDAGKGFFSVNGVYIMSGDPVAGTSPAHTFTPNQAMRPMWFRQTSGFGPASATLRTNYASQTYDPPAGYTSWDVI